jgi:hypothetical protein
LLLGKVFDDRGNAMTPSYAIKKGVRYRYYVSCVLAQGRKEEAGTVKRVAADEIERIVRQAIAQAVPTRRSSAQAARRTAKGIEGVADFGESSEIDQIVRTRVESVALQPHSIDIELRSSDARLADRISVPWTPQTFRRKREVISPSDGFHDGRPIRANARRKLIKAIARARAWLSEIVSGQAQSLEAIAAREGMNERSARMMLSLAFLAPDLIKAAVDGTLPRGFGVSRLMDLPAAWTAQRQALGLPKTT